VTVTRLEVQRPSQPPAGRHARVEEEPGPRQDPQGKRLSRTARHAAAEDAKLLAALRLLFSNPHPIGTQRFATVSSGTSFAQVAGAILQKQARVQNPDKDEVQVLPALGSTCGRRGPYPTVLGRPAPDTEAHFSLGPMSRSLHRALKQHAAAVRASRTNGFALVG
jgi:hypothetical protein